MIIIVFKDFWVWNIVERVVRKCVADIYLYLLLAESVPGIKHTLLNCLALTAFWQLDELTTDVGPRKRLAKIAKIGYQRRTMAASFHRSWSILVVSCCEFLLHFIGHGRFLL